MRIRSPIAENLLLSLILLLGLFWICQSLSLIQREPNLVSVYINTFYLSVIIALIFNFGALKAVHEGEVLDLWINDEGIELFLWAISLILLMSLGSYAM